MANDPECVKTRFVSADEPGDRTDSRGPLRAQMGGNTEVPRRLVAPESTSDQSTGAVDRPLAAGAEAIYAPGAARSMSSPAPGGIEGDGTHVDRPSEAGPDLLDAILSNRYKIRGEIGEGGMGTVYLAEQLRPVRRRVALKLIKRGMDSSKLLARFESERQALALMEHPNIARVLDAGTTADGRPFFVMELVKGIPITEYCDAHCLDVSARLVLFRQVCLAIQHAHQKGIIHRDLKPSNILVESHDDRPVPKVIDFGLAKATSGMRLTEQSLFTSLGSIAGTPLYMAPEQARFNALDIDTRADIYTLGVILYELLTGSTPIARESMRQAAIDEMLRVVREVEPPTPSSRIGTSEALPNLAAKRHVEPARLSRLVRGELDWIVMKALAKERDRRYASAVGLADDIARHLNHEPVSAGPPTAAYQVRKFVRRNRVQVTAAALVILALVLGVLGTSLGLIEARRQRLQAETGLAQVMKMNEILGSIFQDLDPTSVQKDGAQLRAVLGKRLDRATAEIEGEATGDSLAVARMQITLGTSQLGLGYPDRAMRLFTSARATVAAALGPDHPETLRVMQNLAISYHDTGQNERALKLFEQILALTKAKLGPDDPTTLNRMDNLAVSYRAAGQNDRALKLHEETLALKKAKLGPDHRDTLSSMNNLAVSYRAAGQYKTALELREQTLALQKEKLGPDHPDTLQSACNLAISYHDAGQNARGLKLFEETLALRKAKLGPDHPDTLRSMNNLATSYYLAGQNEQALRLYEETLALQKTKLGPDHPDTLQSMTNLAASYKDAADNERALRLGEETLSICRAKLGADHAITMECLEVLAQCEANTGRLDRAEAILNGVVTARRTAQGDGHPDTLRSRISRAKLDLARDRLDAAEIAHRAILDECRSRFGADDRLTITATLALAAVRQAQGDHGMAEILNQTALESARKNPADRDTLSATLAESGRSRLGTGDWEMAEMLLREARAILEAEKPEHWVTAEVQSLLGRALMGAKKTAEATPLLRSGYEGMVRAAGAIPWVDRPRLSEALDRLIAAGAVAGTQTELAAWKAKRATLRAEGPTRDVARRSLTPR